MLMYEMESWKSLDTCLTQDGNDTTILSHHPYVDLAPFSQLRTPQNPPFSGEGVVC